MSEIRVSFSALSTAQADVSGTASRIQAQLDELRGLVAPMASTWDGDASALYLERQRRWDTAAADLNAVLTQIGQALGVAGESYRAVEQGNVGRWT